MALRLPGKTERRLALAILVTAIVPLVAAIFLSQSLFSQAAAIWFNPQVGEQLDRGVGLYRDYVNVVKEDMRHQADAIAADPELRADAVRSDTVAVEGRLDELFPKHPGLVSVRVDDKDGNALGQRDRGAPVDDAKEKKLEVTRSLGDDLDAPVLHATFATDRKHLDELEANGAVVTNYHQIEHSRGDLYDDYVRAYIVLLVLTMLIALVSGTILARGVTRRINRLAVAIDVVAKGDDLSVRVPITGSDELTDLAVTFNRMLEEMSGSRARIEYLQRISAWQEMAQRLAHEIKNPLTPIQLAVQECHRRYDGDNPKYRALLDTTLEVVEEEVAVLRRLVGDFSNFARLPQAELANHDLREFFRECKEQLGHLEDASYAADASFGDVDTAGASGEVPGSVSHVDVQWKVPDTAVPAAIDRQMLRRVLVNLVRNSVQALRDARKGEALPLGHVQIEVRRQGTAALIVVEDDGPGIAPELRGRIFEPYYTTKSDGTGLGLAIVKKVVVEHGGTIEIDQSPMGGARFTIRLPGPRSTEIAAIKEARERAREAGVATGGAAP